LRAFRPFPTRRSSDLLRHDAVLRGGADPDAVGAVFEEQPEAADDRSRKPCDHDPVPGIVEIEELEVAGERLVDLARHRAELPERDRKSTRLNSSHEWI